MESSIVPLFAATLTAAGILGFLATKPSSPSRTSRVDMDGGGFLGDMYESASKGLRQARNASTKVVSDLLSKKDHLKRRTAAKISEYDPQARAARAAAVERYRKMKARAADRYNAASSSAATRFGQLRNATGTRF